MHGRAARAGRRPHGHQVAPQAAAGRGGVAALAVLVQRPDERDPAAAAAPPADPAAGGDPAAAAAPPAPAPEEEVTDAQRIEDIQLALDCLGISPDELEIPEKAVFAN